jgi:ankyrin repeat protein
LTALHIAVYRENYEIINILINHGIDINAKDNEGKTALHVASEYGLNECIKILLDQGASMNEKDNQGQTPLHLASENGFYESVAILISNGANINAQNNQGETPLHIVSANSFNNCLNELLDSGADINIKNNRGQTPVHLAINARTYTKERYRYQFKVEHRDYKDADICLKTLFKYFLLRNADVNIIDNNGNTPLHLVAETGRYRLLIDLLNLGADWTLRNHAGYTAYDLENNQGKALIKRWITENEHHIKEPQLL